MKFKTQLQALDKLEAQTRKALRQLEDRHAADILKLWSEAKLDLSANVMREYHQDFPRGRWDVVQANQKGTLRRMRRAISERLGHFHNQASTMISKGLREIYRAEIERGLWMLDTTTPDSTIAVRPLRSQEAAAPQDFAAGWKDALENWLAAYEDQLASQLRLEALHEGDIDDAADEVDSAKIGNAVPANKFQALFMNQAMLASQEARDDLYDSNAEDAAAEMIWMTMEDAVVCPICDKYDGEKYEDVGDDIPAHFNCRCYTRIVPTKWAELLRSGDADDKELALKMDDAGHVPSSMAIFDSDGDLMGSVSVSFEKWKEKRGANLYGMAITGGVK